MSVDMKIFEEALELVNGSSRYELSMQDFVFEVLCDGYGGVSSEMLAEKFGYEHFEQDGGGEGGAEDCHAVFKLGDKTYRTYYWYRSHYGYGTDGIVDNLEEVKPVQKMVTVFESV